MCSDDIDIAHFTHPARGRALFIGQMHISFNQSINRPKN